MYGRLNLVTGVAFFPWWGLDVLSNDVLPGISSALRNRVAGLNGRISAIDSVTDW